MQIATYVLILSNPIWRYPSLIHKFEIFFKIQQSEGEATLRGGFFFSEITSFVCLGARSIQTAAYIFMGSGYCWGPR